MSKNAKKIIITVISLGLIASVFWQYNKNIKLEDELGSVYLSNITDYWMHLNHMEAYLRENKDMKANELNEYIYEANYLHNIYLPGNIYLSAYSRLIEKGFGVYSTTLNKGSNPNELESIRNELLETIKEMKSKIEQMKEYGSIKTGNSFTIDFSKYYKLSFPENELMKKLNSELQVKLKVALQGK